MSLPSNGRPYDGRDGQLENLFGGISPRLLKKVYPMKPKTGAEFLTTVKLHSEAGDGGWPDSVS